MSEGDLQYLAAHLGFEQWNDIPESSQIRYSYNHDKSDKEEESDYSRVISFLFDFMAENLTARQFEVMRMYHLDYHLTQNAIAQVLKITQPTVNQHINGKKRNGKHVGGAYRRIRREVCSIVNNDDLSSNDRQILRFLMSLGKPDISFKQRRRLLGSLQ